MDLIPVPAFSDNYIWLLHDGRQALVVDPGDARPVLEALRSRHLRLAAILLTHHHADHVGGVADLLRGMDAAADVPLWGPAHERLPPPPPPWALRQARDGDMLQAPGGPWQVLEVPGHTRGHIAFFSAAACAQPLLFCGDTLFSAGCGRLFEGTAAQMQTSLDALAALPDETLVCCAHEYTLGNLRFALAVEPDNAHTAQYLRQCEMQRQRDLPTLPARLGTERAINPFLRTRQPAVAAAARGFDARVDARDPASVLAALRQWKNTF